MPGIPAIGFPGIPPPCRFFCKCGKVYENMSGEASPRQKSAEISGSTVPDRIPKISVWQYPPADRNYP
jgi:hypothetical protein